MIERFPMRRASCIWVLNDSDGEWLVIGGDHGWSYGDFPSALADASWLSQNRAMPIRLKRITA
jgi:hypothetical protein